MKTRETSCRIALLLPLVLIGATGCTHTTIYQKSAGRRATAAVLILPGEHFSPRGMRAMGDYFPQHEFDVYIPDYESRDGLAAGAANVAAFVEEHGLDQYDRLYVLAYLLGGWTLNTYLDDHSLDNLERVVYIRSPIEERMAKVVLDHVPRLVRLSHGSTPQDMRDTPYPPMEKGDREVGLIIENRAIPYLQRHKDEVLALGELEWSPEALCQEHDDFMHVPLHHDEMYVSFNQIGPEIMHFFRHGRFTEDARREPYPGDPFAGE